MFASKKYILVFLCTKISGKVILNHNSELNGKYLRIEKYISNFSILFYTKLIILSRVFF